MNNENYREELNIKTDKQIKALAKKHGVDTSLDREALINALIEKQAEIIQEAEQPTGDETQDKNSYTSNIVELHTTDTVLENAEVSQEENKPTESIINDTINTEEAKEQVKPTNEIIQIPIDRLDASPLNFFSPLKPAKYTEVKDSIEALGLLQPILVRPKADSRYEILAGHNRVTICKDLGWKDITAIIKDVSDNEAEEIIADTNIAQRTEFTPLEIAKAYEIKAKALGNRRGQRSDLGNGEKFTVRDEIGKEYKVAGRTVDRYLSLNNLIPEFQELLEKDKIKSVVGFDLGLLDTATQKAIAKNIDMTNDSEIGKINKKNVGALKTALKDKNDLTVEQKKELKAKSKDTKPQSLTSNEVKAILNNVEVKSTIAIKIELPYDIDEDALEVFKNEPTTVIRLVADYIDRLRNPQLEKDNLQEQ